jgi:hypothetical protein
LNVSSGRFREMLLEALEDPASARAVVRRLALPAFPVQGGVCTNPNTIMSGNFGATCEPGGTQDNGNFNFGGTGRVGIGTTSPATIWT